MARAVPLWQALLRGRFRLLDNFCSFVEAAPKDIVSEDSWRQVKDVVLKVNALDPRM